MSTIKRKMKLSGNVAFPTMLQSVLCLVFLFSVEVDRTTKRKGGGGGGEGSWWWSVCHSSIQFSFKVKNWKLMSIFDYRYFLSWKIRKCQIENFGLFFFVIEYWNITYMFTLILSTMRRKMKLSGDVAFPTMLQFVAWLSFSVFGGSVKIENWKLQSIFNFCFSPKTFKIFDRTTQEGGGGVHSRGNFCAQHPLRMTRSASLLKGSGKEVRV